MLCNYVNITSGQIPQKNKIAGDLSNSTCDFSNNLL